MTFKSMRDEIKNQKGSWYDYDTIDDAINLTKECEKIVLDKFDARIDAYEKWLEIHKNSKINYVGIKETLKELKSLRKSIIGGSKDG